MNYQVTYNDDDTDIFIGIDNIEKLTINGKAIHRIYYDNGRHIDADNIKSFKEIEGNSG